MTIDNCTESLSDDAQESNQLAPSSPYFSIQLTPEQEILWIDGKSLMLVSEDTQTPIDIVHQNRDRDNDILRSHVIEVAASLNALGVLFSNTPAETICEHSQMGVGVGEILFDLAGKITVPN